MKKLTMKLDNQYVPRKLVHESSDMDMMIDCRLTEKRYGQNVIPLRQDGKTKWAVCDAGRGDATTQFLYGTYANKLAEYEDLEEKGKLLKLPCTVGDTVYEINKTRHMVSSFKIKTISITEHGIFFEWKLITGICRISGFHAEEIGRIVFLTIGEAEKALWRMEGAHEEEKEQPEAD